MAYISFQPSDYFNTVLYTGNGSTQSITGVGFQPDWCWIKGRGSSAYDHQLFDVVRGVTKAIASNDTAAESTFSNSLTSFDSDGFSLGDFARTNSNGDNKVSWNWLAGGSQGSSNTNGSINTTYTSANTTAGFSISTYTGTGSSATVGHGLGVAPDVVMIKRTDDTADWRVFTKMTGNQSQLSLSQTSAADSSNTTMWNSTSPTTTTFSIGTHSNVNSNGGNFVAYSFAQKKGFSKFGSYTGSGAKNFIYTGFKPAWLMVKKTSGTDAWVIVDNKRNINNPSSNYLLANASSAEGGGLTYDFLSNGFAFNDSSQNTSSASYIYMAFAEHPLVSSNNIPATAK